MSNGGNEDDIIQMATKSANLVPSEGNWYCYESEKLNESRK